MLNQDDFTVYEVLVYLVEIREAGGALCVRLTPPLHSLCSLESRIEYIVV